MAKGKSNKEKKGTEVSAKKNDDSSKKPTKKSSSKKDDQNKAQDNKKPNEPEQNLNLSSSVLREKSTEFDANALPGPDQAEANFEGNNTDRVPSNEAVEPSDQHEQSIETSLREEKTSKKTPKERPSKATATKATNDFSIPAPVEEKAEPLQEIPALSTEAETDYIPSPLKITFHIKFSTQLGQALFITGNHFLFGNNDLQKAYPMQYLNHEYWYAVVEIPDRKAINEDITYNYYLRYEDGASDIDWGADKTINPSEITSDEILIVDTWNYAGYFENTFYTEPFTEVLLKENYTEVPPGTPEKFTHTFKVKSPLLPKNYVLCLAGGIDELGNWNTDQPLLLSRKKGDNWWTVSVDLSKSNYPFTYKYGVYNLADKQFVRWEDGNNRIFYDTPSPSKQTVVADGFAVLPNNSFKGAGVAIPVFGLRTNNSFGVGEFNDMKLLVDWAKSIGLKLVQILPINDTTATYTSADSYPYAAISAFALHPIYLNLASVVDEKDQALLHELEPKREGLNKLKEIDYVEVVKTKLDFLKRIFPSLKKRTFNSEEFRSFFTENEHWLVPYAAFSYLRDENNTADFTQWSTNKTYRKEDIESFAAPVDTADEKLSIHYFIQYHLHLQLKAATEYAHQNGIIVKGDIPIGIFRNSCDAWQQPELYNMDKQAGAPPDDFAVKGQNWGFPTYNWPRMAMDGFTWWKKRFQQMSYYFDAFRIDHILGFFRIWSIPMHAVEGIMGNFVPALPVHINEFYNKGIHFDHHRFTKPFINNSVLWELFGEGQEVVKQFLFGDDYGNYQLLPQFDTQRKIESHFDNLDKNDFNKKLQQGLYDLISNVLLFEVEDSQGQQFHFRISAERTTSFRYLDNDTKNKLWDLYIDYFYKRQDNFWMKEAMMKLPELKRSTNMLICGEDLGMVPHSVPPVMKNLGILSLEIQRMPKDPTKEFFHPNDAPYLSVVTPSTHDMSTIRGWWEEDRVKTQRFYNTELGQFGEAPFFCEPWINKAIVLQHLYSPAMWSIFQLQDLLGIDGAIRRSDPNEERINVPADPKHYWRYRMHINFEDLQNEEEFNKELSEYIKISGRN